MGEFFKYTKLMFKCDDDFWNRVKRYKREMKYEDMNAAVRELLDQSLKVFEEKLNSPLPHN